MSRWKIILRAWPPAGAMFVILSFLVTGFWLWHSFSGKPEMDLGWLEPLAAFLAGAGAFILAAILIFRRVDNARAEADTYGLARGLATGYYFNFVRPMVTALSDPKHPLHAEVAETNGHELEGLVVGFPQRVEDFAPDRHDALLKGLDGPFKLVEFKIVLEDRPRPVFIKAVLSESTKTAVVVDIPTTLSVVTDFANFVAEKELGDAPAADDAVIEAREEIVANSQTDQFREVLIEFVDVVNKIGSKESREHSPASLVHVVPLKRLSKRLDELADH